MPFKAQQKSIIKLVCLYPITVLLWMLDFILYNWQELTGEDRSNDNKIEIYQYMCHIGEPHQVVTKELLRLSEKQYKYVIFCTNHSVISADYLQQFMNPIALKEMGYSMCPTKEK